MRGRTATPIPAGWQPVRPRRIEVTGRVSFGEFMLDAETRELRRGSKPSRFHRKPTSFWRRLSRTGRKPSRRSLFRNAVARHLRGREEPRQPDRRDSRRPWRRCDAPAFHAHGPPVRLFVSGGAGQTTGSAHREPDPLRLIWAEGRAGLGEGEHVLGRDPELELFLDAPGVSRRHALISIVGEEATLEIWAARTARSSPIVVSTRAHGSLTVT